MKQYRWLLALVVGAFLLAACGGMQAAVPEIEILPASGPIDISASVTTVPENSTVLHFGMVSLNANATEIDGCAYVWKLDLPVPPDASGTIAAPAPYVGDITFTVTGNKDAGYTIQVTDTVAGFTVVIERAYFGIGNDARKFTFDPGVTYASPLPAPLNPTGGLGDISHTHFCYDFVEDDVEELTVTKTAVTSFTREHFWDIDKSVETEEGYELDGFPKIWLYTDGSGDETATWTVDVTYEGFEDGGFNVSGEITIVNTGTLNAVITAVDDVLGGMGIDVDCGVGFPYTLLVGETLACTYDEDGYVEGFNEVTITTERDTYFDDAEIVWGDPTTEIDKTVSIKDISGLFGEVGLGTATAPNGDQFTYTKDFAWVDYGADGCGSFMYDNTAKIVETGQEADATLKVNVQCFVFDGETAWAANGAVPLELRYTNRGNWATYVEYAEKTTTLFAGQTIVVGTVSFSAVDDGQVTIGVTLTGDWEFEDVAENLKVQDYASAPSGNPEPGLFAHKKTCEPDLSTCSIVVPANNFYGVHVNVGQWIPDPDFGP